jgi:hypothetical protein
VTGSRPLAAVSAARTTFGHALICHVKIKAKVIHMTVKRKDGGRDTTMGYVGKVTRGTVVLPPEANLPEGTPVRIEPIAPETLAARLKKVIGVIHDMPSDWAENHDHYIHGASKK